MAAATVAASVSLSTAMTDPLAESGLILATAYGLARIVARYAVFIGAPAALITLVVLLMVGGYGHQPDEESESEHLSAFLGRIVMGSALFAAVGLACQLMLAAKLGGWF